MASLLDPFTFPKNKYHQKITIPNRAFRTAIGMALCSPDWLPLPELIDFYKSISSAGAGMYTLEQCAVHESGKAIFPQLGIHDDKFIPYHQQLVGFFKGANQNNIRVGCRRPNQSRGLVGIQLSHSGNLSKREDRFDINDVSESQILSAIGWYVDAAIRSMKAGYDYIQLQVAHGFLIHQTISTAHNQRTDQWNASGCKFLLKTISGIRKACPSILLGIKMNFDDFMDGVGMTPEQSVEVIRKIDVDFVEISGGSSDKRAKFPISRDDKFEFYHQHSLAKLVESGLNKKQPVIVSGGFVKSKTVQDALNLGADMVGFGRQFNHDTNFLSNGFAKPCIHCNRCSYNLWLSGGDARCLNISKPIAQTQSLPSIQKPDIVIESDL